MFILKQSSIQIQKKNILSKAKGFLVGILMFFLIWDVNFSFIPFTSNIYLALLGILIFPFTFKFKISKDDIVLICLYMAMLLYAIIVLLMHQTSDFEFISDELIRYIIVPFFGAWFVAYVGKDFFSSKEELLRCIIRINLLQSIFIILEFTIPAFKKIIFSIQTLTENGLEEMIEEGVRAFGLGAGYDLGAFTMSFSLLITIYLYFSEDGQKSKIRYLFYFFLQALAGLLMARSIFFGVVISVLFFLCITGPNASKKKIKIIMILICIVVSAIILLTVFSNQLVQFTQKYSKTLTWIFEFFIWDKVRATGKKTNSLLTLIGMYSFPGSLKVWFIGEGRYVTAHGNPYRDLDPFYMRFLYFWGLPGIVLYLTFLKEIIINIKKKCIRHIGLIEDKKNEKLFFLLLSFMFVMCLTIDIKLISHNFWILFLLMCFFYLKEYSTKK